MICLACQGDNREEAETCYSCGAPLPGPLRPGQFVAARYEIDSALGRGGMGIVYKARDRVTDAVVALKVLHADWTHAPEMARRFAGEIQTARRIRHRIAKRTEAEVHPQSALTATGRVLGTPEYMSPEQARGEGVDTRTDLYSLGVVIYEMFTGHVPFRGDTAVATILKHIEEPPALSGPRAAGIPAALVPVLRKALAKDRERRYTKARGLAEALRLSRAVLTPRPGL